MGIKFHDNFGLEAGYGFNKIIQFKPAGVPPIDTFTVRNMYLDLVGFMPASDKIQLIAGLGIGKLTAKPVKDVRNGYEVKNKFGWRAKLGAQYNFNTNLGARLTATYQQVSSKIKSIAANQEFKAIKNIKTIGLGVFYTF